MNNTFTEPATMLDAEQYASSVPRLEHEANWAFNSALEAQHQAERAEPELVQIKRYKLVLKATTGWELQEQEDLVRPRSFVNRRPGARPGKVERAAMENMPPAVFMRELFEQGIPFQAAPDDIVYAVLLAFAKAHYGPSDMRAARQLTTATKMLLAIRAGIELTSSEEVG